MSLQRKIYVVILFIIPILFRLINFRFNFLPPNTELITSCSCGVLCLLSNKKQNMFLLPSIIVGIGDFLIGNSLIFLFTLSAWIIIGYYLNSIKKTMYDMPLKTGVFAAVFSSLFFYIWTNFGVWCLSHGMWYTFDIDGLVKCYVAGLPFLRNMFLGNLILCPMVTTCCSKLGAADVFLETGGKDYRMSGPEERERAVDLYYIPDISMGYRATPPRHAEAPCF